MNITTRIYTLFFIVSCFALASCGGAGISFGTDIHHYSGETNYGGYFANNRLSQSADNYLLLAKNAPAPARYQYQLDAAQRYLQNKQNSKAHRVLNTLSMQPIANDVRIRQQLLQARYYFVTEQPLLTLRTLNEMPAPTTLKKDYQIDYRSLAAQAFFKSEDYLSSVKERIALQPLLNNGNAAQQNIAITWKAIQNIPTTAVDNLLQTSQPPTLTGWLQLAQINQLYANNDVQFARYAKQWKRRHPNHIANNVLTNLDDMVEATDTYTSKKITLLVPLSGSLGANGKAVRNGFLAAYYQAKKSQLNSPRITVLDSQQKNIATLYDNASANSDIIVGPLSKNKLTELVNNHRIHKPTIALNTLPGARKSNLYQFGLSPQDEAIQAANKAWQDGHHHALIIAPSGQWGQNIAQSFATQWEAQGGTIAANLAFTNRKTLESDISRVLQIKDSKSRAKALQKTLHENFRFVPERRRDIDMIFISALPDQAKQIRPMLNYFFAGDIPTYATSLVYDGNNTPHHNSDLDGVMFVDMPWVLDSTSKLPANLRSIKQRVQQLWHTSYQRYPKMYALGIDAYYLATHLQRINTFPNAGISAASGSLYLTGNNHVVRRLYWAKMKNGQPYIMQR